jgi:hypothetical protein
VVADRGMISAETIAELEARRLLYILGLRERTDKLVRELVLADTAPFVPLVMKKRSKEIDYEAKTVKLAGAALQRLPQPAGGREGCRRPPIVAALARQLAKGDRALVGNNGYRRYLKTIRQDHLSFRDRPEGEKVRRHFRAAHQHRSQSARSHAPLLQADVDGGANFPRRQAPVSTRPGASQRFGRRCLCYRDAGIDLSRPFFFPPDHGRYSQIISISNMSARHGSRGFGATRRSGGATKR